MTSHVTIDVTSEFKQALSDENSIISIRVTTLYFVEASVPTTCLAVCQTANVYGTLIFSWHLANADICF
jgi:hypothetical protein